MSNTYKDSRKHSLANKVSITGLTDYRYRPDKRSHEVVTPLRVKRYKRERNEQAP